MKRILIVLTIGATLALFFANGYQQYLSFEFLQSQRSELINQYEAHPALFVSSFAFIYVVVTALSLPGAVILTLAGGAIFGVLIGTLVVSFASTAGATIAMLLARFVLRDLVEQKFRSRTEKINLGINRDGWRYLLALRLVPIAPFFLINIAMGMTRFPVSRYWIVSQLGMIPGTIVYVNAGTQLAQLQSLQGILSVDIAIAFALLAAVPIISKFIMLFVRHRQIYKQFSKPKDFQYNVVAIGAGAGGLVTSYIAAATKARVALVEAEKMGGDCLNTGCVPSKALIRSAKAAHEISTCEQRGIKITGQVEVDFNAVMKRIKNVVTAIEPHDSVERYTNLGVECYQGYATIVSPWEVKVGDEILTTKSIVVASGAEPFVPPIPGIEDIPYLTSETLWQLAEAPSHLVVLGGGPIGTELSQAFGRLGIDITQIEMAQQIVVREDPEVATLIREKLTSEGINVLTDHEAIRIESNENSNTIICLHNNEEVSIPFSHLLVAIGRKARVSGFGLDTVGVELTSRNTIQVDEFMRTSVPNIYACGDVAGPYQFTHTAAHTAWYATVNALLRPFKKFEVDYSCIPWVTYTDPEIARVGINETEAISNDTAYKSTVYQLEELDRAITDDATDGFVKVLTRPGSDEILGVTIVGHNAGEILAEFTLAKNANIGLNKILGTIHPYPTYAEANKYTAGEWKRSNLNPSLLSIAQKFNQWRR